MMIRANINHKPKQKFNNKYEEGSYQSFRYSNISPTECKKTIGSIIGNQNE